MDVISDYISNIWNYLRWNLAEFFGGVKGTNLYEGAKKYLIGDLIGLPALIAVPIFKKDSMFKLRLEIINFKELIKIFSGGAPRLTKNFSNTLRPLLINRLILYWFEFCISCVFCSE